MILSFVFAAAEDGADAGKAIALGVGGGLGAVGAGVGIGIIFGKVIESVTRQPEMRDEITSIQWLGFALTEACFFYGLVCGPDRLLPLGRDDDCPDHRSRRGERGGRQLPRRARRRADDLDAARLRHRAAHPAGSSPSRGSPRRSTSASRRSRSRSTPPSGPSARPTSCCAEYRERLTEARGQADEIVARARKAGEAAEDEIVAEARAKREEMMEQTRRDIEAETRRAIQEIRAEVADLTVLATEKVTRKTLDRRRPEAARRGGARRARLRRARRRGAPLAMEEIAEVYARSLFEVAKEQDKLDDVREQLGAVRRRARRRPRAAGVLLLALLLHRRRRRTGSTARSPDADPVVVNFLELLIENHRMPVDLPHPRASSTRCGSEENKLLPVADHVARSSSTRPPSSSIGDRIGEQTGRKVELTATRRARHPRRHRRPGRQLDPRRLHPQPPRTTSQAGRQGRSRSLPFMQIKPDEITSILKSRIEGLDAGQAELTEVGTVLSVGDGIARIHGLENCMAFEMLELPARRDRPRAEPRVRQRRRRAVRRVGEDRRGRHGQAHRTACSRSRSARRCSAASSPRSASRSTARATSTPSETRPAEFKAPGVVQRQPVKEPMQTGLKAIDAMIPIGRGQRELIIGDRQTGKTAIAIDTIINNKDSGRHLGLRRDRPAHVDGRRPRRDARGRRRARQHDHRRRAGRRGRADQVHGALRRLRDGRALPLQRQARAGGLRRPHQARVRLPPDVAAAAPPAGARGLPGRRLLPAQPPARARGQAQRRPRRRLADRAADHRDAGRRRVGLHPDERHLDHRRPDLPRAEPLLLGRAPGHQRRHLGVARGRQRADQRR